MNAIFLLVLTVAAGVLSAPADEASVAPRASISISTPDFKGWGETAKNIVKHPNEIAKDSVDLVKDTVKMGSGIGGAVISKGTELASQGVSAATDIGKLGINMGTTIADKTLGIVGKVGNMIPIAGTVVTAGTKLGQSGVQGIKSIGDSLMDSIKSWMGTGLGWVSDTTKKGNELIDAAADTVGNTVNAGIDFKSDTVGNVIAAGLGSLPEVKLTADINLG